MESDSLISVILSGKDYLDAITSAEVVGTLVSLIAGNAATRGPFGVVVRELDVLI